MSGDELWNDPERAAAGGHALSARELPFIGELLQVRAEEQAWEGAAERLLHSFALRVIVPERHYDRFSRHVDRTHLGGRLVYSRVPESLPPQGIRDDDPARFYNKLEVKRAVESLFKVKVVNVRMARYLGKIRRVGRHMGRRPQWKKAYVTLREGDKIDFFGGA